jgi:exonuclease III
MDSLELPRQWKMDMRFGTWNVRSLSRAGSLKTAASELTKSNLGLVVVQEIRWVEGGSQSAANYTFFWGNGNSNHHLGTAFIVHKGIVSAVKRVEFFSDRLLYITQRGHCCDINFLNVCAPTEDKSDDTKDNFYEEVECVYGFQSTA